MNNPDFHEQDTLFDETELPVVRNPATYWRRFQDYIRHSPRWKAVVDKTKYLAGYQCQRCHRNALEVMLECHHRTYINVFKEVPGVDTVCLCRQCHEQVHADEKAAANDNWIWPRKDEETA